MKPKLYITRELFDDIVAKLSEYYEVEVWDKYHHPPHDVLLSKAREADALVTLLTDRVDCNLLQNSPKLRIVAQYAVGFDNVDIECATRLGIYVTNTPDVISDTVAELTWALILAVTKRILESDAFVRRGEWRGTGTPWHPKMMLGAELKGKVLGIIGLGRIGTRVAKIGVLGFGMKVVYYDIVRYKEKEGILGVEYRSSLEDLLREADIVSLHVPLTPQTKHMINENTLRLMKKTAILVNTARGAVVDTNALVKALREGWIAGAGIDVFEGEPIPADHPLTQFKNVVLAPHVGSATFEGRYRMAQVVLENLVAFYEGRRPPTLVNEDVLKVRPPGFK
ncbi:MAG: glyoxylate reductase [Sulfolobales archaeon]|nr:glyoxylate reductase [Sulfolobales archaeon]MDW8082327.1 glyoxylate reductase [Sulfolobales archaeon]